MHSHARDLPIIVLADLVDETLALEALRKGAQEYLVKGEIHGRMLSRVIRYAIERIHAERHAKAEKLRSDRLARRLAQVVGQLKETQREMLVREKALATGELAAGVAHEIRNPLSIISMSVQYLQSKFPARDPRREFTEAIVRKVEHLDRITKRLLSFGRRRELVLRRQNIPTCLNRALSLFKVKCKTQEVKVIKRYRKNLPRVLLDEEAIEEIYSNLFSNALEAMPRGGRLEIRTAYDRLSQAVTVRISDTGSGIQKKNRHHLFQPFFSTKKERGGSGLGLAISNRIANDHGGSMTVESRTSGPHRGTSFILHLPVKISKADGRAPTRTSHGN